MHAVSVCVGLVGAAMLVFAPTPPAFAQQNPAARGTSTAPAIAARNRLPLQVNARAVTGFSPFPATCGDTNGTMYSGAEVEPHIAINPLNPNNLIGVWQQDRYSNGSSRGVASASSFDGGVTWTTRTLPISVCAGGPFDRATDPWVTFSPDGTAHQIALGTIGSQNTSAILASRSSDGGLTWSAPATLILDGVGFFNDKETITADPTDSRFVYAVWDRLHSSGGGPTGFARSTDGGLTWEPAREIFTPAASGQTIGNVIRVLPDGTLVNVFTLIIGNGAAIDVMRSTDRGVTWSDPIVVSALFSLGASDPTTGAAIRDGSILPEMAVGRDGTLHVVWQDARYTQQRDAISLSRSTDGGRTWSTPVRVNANPSVPAFTPQVHVRDDGEIGITYYDFRSDSAAPSLLTDYWLARSSDGVNWTETRVSEPFDLTFAPNAGGFFLGDYTGLTSSGATFIAFFGRTNSTTANRTDIVAARLEPAASASAKRSESIEPVIAYRAERLPDTELDARFASQVSERFAKIFEKRIAKVRPPVRAPESPVP